MSNYHRVDIRRFPRVDLKAHMLLQRGKTAVVDTTETGMNNLFECSRVVPNVPYDAHTCTENIEISYIYTSTCANAHA